MPDSTGISTEVSANRSFTVGDEFSDMMLDVVTVRLDLVDDQGSPSTQDIYHEAVLQPMSPPVSPRATGSAPSVSVGAPESSSSSVASPSPKPTTVHQQPKWLPALKENFAEQIIAPCSGRTRKAVEENEYIEVSWYLRICIRSY